tara:strand:+ start:166 stop:327 length:162 start_codon:yes stop_codon:yes gene_type:complete
MHSKEEDKSDIFDLMGEEFISIMLESYERITVEVRPESGLGGAVEDHEKQSWR